MQRLASFRKNFISAWFFIAAIGLLLILAAALGGVIKNYYEGEEFIIYHYANKLPHNQAWQSFFRQFGRPIEAMYWTYQYEVFGFKPLLTHSLSFFLLLVVAMLASACFLNAWPQSKRSKILPFLLTFSLFSNWVFTSSVLRQSYDNGRVSLIPFFLAGLAVQRWAVTQRGRWLILSFILFFLSVLTYENAAFLFPALVLLAFPLLPAPKKGSARFKLLVFAGLSAASALVLLISRWFYVTIARPVATPALEFSLSDLPIRLVKSSPLIYLQFGQFHNFGDLPVNLLISTGLQLTLVVSSVWIVKKYKCDSLAHSTRSRWTYIYIASLWFLIFGPLPYILLGYSPGGRVYSSAVVGVFPLMLILYETSKRQFLRIGAGLLLFFFGAIGLLMLMDESTYFNQQEAPLNAFYRGLKDAVPHVRPHTAFIIINAPLSTHGCGPSLEMLYNQHDLECLALFSNFDLVNIRRDAEFESDGLDIDGPNWIVIAMVDGVPVVVEELKPGDFDLVIIWESTEPIQTNTSRILTDENRASSGFYEHLLKRAEVLFPE